MAAGDDKTLADLKRRLVRAEDTGAAAQCEVLTAMLAVVPSKVALKTSGAGITVARLAKKSTTAPDVQRLCKQVIASWKNAVDTTTTHTSTAAAVAAATNATRKQTSASSTVEKPTSSRNSISGTTGVGSDVASDVPPRSASAVSQQTTRVSDSTPETDGLHYHSTGDRLRDKCVVLLYGALRTDATSDPKTVLRYSIELEELTYRAYTPADSYKARIRTLSFNLRDPNNPELREWVNSGAIPALRLCSMSTEDMASRERKDEVEKLKKEALNEIISAGDTQAETDMFKCGKCGKRKCKYFQMQTRSADEPMTTFVTCVHCGNKWKFC